MQVINEMENHKNKQLWPEVMLKWSTGKQWGERTFQNANEEGVENDLHGKKFQMSEKKGENIFQEFHKLHTIK